MRCGARRVWAGRSDGSAISAQVTAVAALGRLSPCTTLRSHAGQDDESRVDDGGTIATGHAGDVESWSSVSHLRWRESGRQRTSCAL